MSATSSSTNAAASNYFSPITKSSSVPDIHKNSDSTNPNSSTKGKKCEKNGTQNKEQNNLLATNSDSIESAIASPAGSLEQFEVSGFNNSTLPLTPEDATDLNGETMKENQTTSNTVRFDNNNSGNVLGKQFDASSPSFRFRRHSSQSSLNVPNMSNLVAGAVSGSANALNNNPERVCSSPINSLKMSSRVCQIKISEGIEPHLNHEIKSERDMQSTLKLKSSCDDLMLSNDDYDNKDSNRTGNNSPNTVTPATSIFRHNSQSNMPSPSMSSCYSYSNSCSPTGGISTTNNPGFVRCFSPSASIAINNSPSLSAQSQIANNYFSQSPSPTRKLFLSRRSMSPIPCLIRPNSFSAPGSKRKFSDVESTEPNPHASPKRSNTDSQEFVQPLLIYTGSSRSIVRSQTSSPFSPLAATPSSPNHNAVISSLIITAPASCDGITKMQTNADDDAKPLPPSKSFKMDSPMSAAEVQGSSQFLWPPVSEQKQPTNEEASNKYTFKPIQLPPPTMAPTSTSLSFQPTTCNNKNQQQSVRKLRSSTNQTTSAQATNLSNTALFASLAQLNSPLNSPAQYLCDSPISYSPSISITSSSITGEKPDSGYQSSIQNISDSESCN